jgi:hypothetical protein
MTLMQPSSPRSCAEARYALYQLSLQTGLQLRQMPTLVNLRMQADLQALKDRLTPPERDLPACVRFLVVDTTDVVHQARKAQLPKLRPSPVKPGKTEGDPRTE